MGYAVEIAPERCEGCKECVEICPVNVYKFKRGKPVAVNSKECLGCESCVEACEKEAITISFG